MLIRELEYEYVGVRVGFTTGLLAFMVAQGLRARLALRRSKELSWCAMLFLLSAASALLAYNNSMTLFYGGYSGLLGRWASLHCSLLLRNFGLANPIVILSVGTFVLAMLLLLRLLAKTLIMDMDTDGDGRVSYAELRAWLRKVRSQGIEEEAEEPEF